MMNRGSIYDLYNAIRSTVVRVCNYINFLEPSGNLTYHQVLHSKILHGVYIAFMCFVRISEQTATFAL
jgi:hypothetical protein